VIQFGTSPARLPAGSPPELGRRTVGAVLVGVERVVVGRERADPQVVLPDQSEQVGLCPLVV
jgi:hypothetical protein